MSPWKFNVAHEFYVTIFSVKNPLLERMPNSVGTVGRLSDHGTGNGRDERKGKRAHVLVGGRGPLAQTEEGRVQGSATRTAKRRQAPQVVETPSEERGERRPTELVKSTKDYYERPFVQVSTFVSATRPLLFPAIGYRSKNTSRNVLLGVPWI